MVVKAYIFEGISSGFGYYKEENGIEAGNNIKNGCSGWLILNDY
jgi:hypothetical protein